MDRKICHSGFTVQHHSASLVMPISDRFFYLHHTPMKDTYYLINIHWPWLLISLHTVHHQCILLHFTTGYKQVHQFSLPAETVRHIWLLQRLSAISCFLPRLFCLENSFLQRLSAGSRITQTVTAGSHFLWMEVSAGGKRSWTVVAKAKYDRQSLQEAKISGLIFISNRHFQKVWNLYV